MGCFPSVPVAKHFVPLPEMEDIASKHQLRKDDLGQLQYTFDMILGRATEDHDSDVISEKQLFEFFGIAIQSGNIFRDHMVNLAGCAQAGVFVSTEFMRMVCLICTLNTAGLIDFAFNAFIHDERNAISMESFERQLTEVNKVARVDADAVIGYASQHKQVRKGNHIDLAVFRNIAHHQPNLVIPSQKLQEIIQTHTLGVAAWKAITRNGPGKYETRKLKPGAYPRAKKHRKPEDSGLLDVGGVNGVQAVRKGEVDPDIMAMIEEKRNKAKQHTEVIVNEDEQKAMAASGALNLHLPGMVEDDSLPVLTSPTKPPPHSVSPVTPVTPVAPGPGAASAAAYPTLINRLHLPPDGFAFASASASAASSARSTPRSHRSHQPSSHPSAHATPHSRKSSDKQRNSNGFEPVSAPENVAAIEGVMSRPATSGFPTLAVSTVLDPLAAEGAFGFTDEPDSVSVSASPTSSHARQRTMPRIGMPLMPLADDAKSFSARRSATVHSLHSVHSPAPSSRVPSHPVTPLQPGSPSSRFASERPQRFSQPSTPLPLGASPLRNFRKPDADFSSPMAHPSHPHSLSAHHLALVNVPSTSSPDVQNLTRRLQDQADLLLISGDENMSEMLQETIDTLLLSHPA